MSARAWGWRLAALGIVASLACTSGCRRAGGGGGAPAKLRVQLNWVPEPEFGGLYAARDGGAFAQAGLEVEIRGGGPGTPVVQLVAAGQTDFGVAAGEDVVVARARGVDVVAIFATFQSSPQAIMVHAARGVQTLADLRSGTLALETGAPFGAYLAKKYGFYGVTLVPADGGVARFVADVQHAQQCFVTSEPLAAKARGSDPQIFLGRDLGFDPYANVLITRATMARSDQTRAFLGAVGRGWRDYLADPTGANATMARSNPAMDGKTFAAAADAQRALIESEDTRAHGLGWMRADRWRTLAGQLVDVGTVDRAPRAEDCFTDDALPPP